MSELPEATVGVERYYAFTKVLEEDGKFGGLDQETALTCARDCLEGVDLFIAECFIIDPASRTRVAARLRLPQAKVDESIERSKVIVARHYLKEIHIYKGLSDSALKSSWAQ